MHRRLAGGVQVRMRLLPFIVRSEHAGLLCGRGNNLPPPPPLNLFSAFYSAVAPIFTAAMSAERNGPAASLLVSGASAK